MAMIKCFLSHSSKDKEGYVRIVSSHLNADACIIDEKSFEEGMMTADEIAHYLRETSLFVLFISDDSLASKWVIDELTQAKDLLDEKKLARIYPIIIDDKVHHTDLRIPQWMRDSLSIKYIAKPTVAALRIKQRLIEIAWDLHPRLRERQQIFVGRNDLMKTIEERLSDFSRDPVIALVASGLPSIGRKTLLKHAMRKVNLAREAYQFPTIVLHENEGIEDFILKLNNLSFLDDPSVLDALKGGMVEKEAAAVRLSNALIAGRERVIIEDHGVLVSNEGLYVDWFISLLGKLGKEAALLFLVASKFKARLSLNAKVPATFFVRVPELEKTERNGLLVQYARFNALELSRNDLEFFSDLLSGYPEQVMFCVDFIIDETLVFAKQRSHLIREYATAKASTVIQSLGDDQMLLEFIQLLSRFELISDEVLFDIVDPGIYRPLLERLLSHSVCEAIGAAGEYIRLNESIKDFISRSRFNMPTQFDGAIRKHVDGFFAEVDGERSDISDYLFSTKERLLAGEPVPDELVVPSVFIKAIRKLYDEDRNYRMALILAERVLEGAKYLHANSVRYIRFYKCLILARRDESATFFNELKNMKGWDEQFLLGFYNRRKGDLAKAEVHLNNAMTFRANDPRVTGELVQVYMQSDEFDKALELAHRNYNSYPQNPINAMNYFTCLLPRDGYSGHRSELDKIVALLEKHPSPQAQEMVLLAQAKLAAYYDRQLGKASHIIKDAVDRFPGNGYVQLAKAELAVHARDQGALDEAIAALQGEGGVTKHMQTYRTFVKFKAYSLAMGNRLLDANRLVERELHGLKASTRTALLTRLAAFAPAKNGAPAT